MPLRVQPEHPHRAARGAQQIEQALDGGGFTRAVAAEKAVAAPGPDRQAQAVDGLGFAVGTAELVEFDDGIMVGHKGMR